VMLCGAYDVASYGYFQRGAVKESSLFMARLVAKRSQIGTRAAVQEQGA